MLGDGHVDGQAIQKRWAVVLGDPGLEVKADARVGKRRDFYIQGTQVIGLQESWTGPIV